jgi:hypothetical protein
MTAATLVIVVSGVGQTGRITDGELPSVLILRHGRPCRAWLAAPLLRAPPPGAEAAKADLEPFLGDILRRRSADTATRYEERDRLVLVPASLTES